MLNRNKKTLLCCLKVKSAGLLIGLVDLFLQLIILLALSTAITRPSVYEYYLKQQQQLNAENGGEVAQNNMNFLSVGNMNFLSKQDKTAAFMVTLGAALITSMYVYGILKTKANYLLPYFCLKVFHVVITVLTTLGFYSCLPNVKLWIKMHAYFPYKDELLSLDRQSLELLVFAALTAITLFKMYITVLIWKCYRYVVYKSISLLPTTQSTIATVPESPLGTTADVFTFYKTDDDRRLFTSSSSLPPPKYDEVIQQQATASNSVVLPPPYVVAQANK